MELPPLYFLFTWRVDAEPVLLHRDPTGGTHRCRIDAQDPVPAALALVGPGPPPVHAQSWRFLEAVREAEGSVIPLAQILERLGVRRRGAEGILGALGGTWEGVEDPEVLAREILTRIAEALDSPAAPETVDPDETEESQGSIPRWGDLVRDAPEGPGVYSFHGHDDRVIYVGKAASLRRRLRDHLRGEGPEEAKRAALARDTTGVRWEPLGSELESLIREFMLIRREGPAMNIQRAAHTRSRGMLRSSQLALLLPSISPADNELCLVSGNGRFHWERVRRGRGLPRATWARVVGFLDGSFSGWGPGEPERPLEPSEALELAEIALTWLATREPAVTRVDLTRERGSKELQGRLRRALAVETGGERIEIR